MVLGKETRRDSRQRTVKPTEKMEDFHLPGGDLRELPLAVAAAEENYLQFAQNDGLLSDAAIATRLQFDP